VFPLTDAAKAFSCLAFTKIWVLRSNFFVGTKIGSANINQVMVSPAECMLKNGISFHPVASSYAFLWLQSFRIIASQ
jgi:hypothetical protein